MHPSNPYKIPEYLLPPTSRQEATDPRAPLVADILALYPDTRVVVLGPGALAIVAEQFADHFPGDQALVLLFEDPTFSLARFAPIGGL